MDHTAGDFRHSDPEPEPAPADAGRRVWDRVGRASSSSSSSSAAALAAPPARVVVEVTYSPFHCLYQDAVFFHTQSRARLRESVAESSRLARAAILAYVAAAEALVRQAAVELGRPELRSLLNDPARPLALGECWRLLPAILDARADEVPTPEPARPPAPFDPAAAPWPQFAELLALRNAWAYPGPPEARRAYYGGNPDPEDHGLEPLEPRDLPPELRIPPDALRLPRTGLPRDPYALRPQHLNTARSVLDAAIRDLDRRTAGALTANNRHRREPARILKQTP